VVTAPVPWVASVSSKVREKRDFLQRVVIADQKGHAIRETASSPPPIRLRLVFLSRL